MTSKDELERLYDDYEYLMQEYYKCPIIGLKEEQIIQTKENVNHIKQDLERLETLISILQKFIDEEEYFVLHDKYLSLGIDGSINITQHQCDVLKRVLKFKE